MLDEIQRGAFHCVLQETNRSNGLVRDTTCSDWPASVAVRVIHTDEELMIARSVAQVFHSALQAGACL